MLLRGLDLHCAAIDNLEIVATFSCQIRICEDQTKSHHLSVWPLAGTVSSCDKFGPSYCITFIKRLDESLT